MSQHELPILTAILCFISAIALSKLPVGRCSECRHCKEEQEEKRQRDNRNRHDAWHVRYGKKGCPYCGEGPDGP